LPFQAAGNHSPRARAAQNESMAAVALKAGMGLPRGGHGGWCGGGIRASREMASPSDLGAMILTPMQPPADPDVPPDRAVVTNREPRTMNVHFELTLLQPLIALIAGILILIIPRLLNFIVALYLILLGISGLWPHLLR
jgi:hypothetical protein